ncbi:MAG: TonB-dependent receptor [Balneolia bacterium]|nr:TonB-dependent receptor [Balneolia bacterium]
MKTKQIPKSSVNISHSVVLLAAVMMLVLSISIQTAEAQERTRSAEYQYSFSFSGTPLSEALENLAASAGVNLIFDPDLVANQFVYSRVRGNTINDLLSVLLDRKDLDYIILSSGTYVIVKSAREASSFGSLTGQVVDAETGEPLMGATVMIADASAGTVTNRSGQFSLGGLISGEQELIFSYLGYEPVRKKIHIPQQGNITERITLNSRTVDFFPVVVAAHRPLTAGMHHEQAAEPRNGWNTGNRYNSAIQSLDLFSGVQHGIPMAGTHIQGGQRSEHRMYLDGVPVYNPYSFGQLSSAFSPYAINRIEVDKAGFDASAGSYIAGKINLQHNVSGRAGQNALFQADPLSTNAFGSVRTTTENGRSLELMTAYRTSIWGVYEDPVLSGTLSEWDTIDPLLYNLVASNGNGQLMQDFAPVNNRSDIGYYDVHFAGSYQPGPFGRLSFSLYSGQNDVRTDVLASEQMHGNQLYMFSRDSYAFNNTVAQISYDWIATPRLDLSGQLAYSMNRMQHGYYMADNNRIETIRDLTNAGQDERALFGAITDNIEHTTAQLDSNMLQHYIGRLDAAYAVSPRFSVESGLQADFVRSEFDLSGLFYLPAVDAQESAILSSYTNVHFSLSANMFAKIGSRFTYLDSSGELFAEPRAQLQYDQPESRIGDWSIRLSGGLYRQFINQFDITNAGPSSIVPSFTIWAHDSSFRQPAAWHTAASLVLNPTSTTTIYSETWLRLQPAGYITSYSNLLEESAVGNSGLGSFAEVTDMQAWGAGFRINQELFDSRLKLMGGYDYSNAEVNMESQFGRVMPAPWNHPHSLQGRVLARMTSQFSIVGQWQRVMGRTWAFRESYYNFLMMHNVHTVQQFDLTTPENDRLPAFDQFDVSFIYNQALGFSRVEARLDLMNVLNRRNSIDRGIYAHRTHADGTQELRLVDRRLPGFNPSISLQISF